MQTKTKQKKASNLLNFSQCNKPGESPQVLECGGKRSATPLLDEQLFQSGVTAAALQNASVQVRKTKKSGPDYYEREEFAMAKKLSIYQ